MVVVAIMGVLASVAIPAFMRNSRKAKTSEAIVQLNRIYTSSRMYILEIHGGRGVAGIVPPQFPDAEAPTPAVSCCTFAGQKCPPSSLAGGADWKTPTWMALQFEVTDPHYFQYAYTSTGTAGAGLGSEFRAQAFGDLNCDTVQSTFELYGVWNNTDHDVHGSAGFAMVNPLE